MKELRAKLNELKELHAAYNVKAAKLTAAQIAEEVAKFKKVRAELQEILTKGADDCEGGHRPIGIFHEGTPNPFEIGDPVVPNRRSRGAFLEDAVEKWNDEDYLPPREPETVVATHKDAGGNVISQKTVKLQKK